MANLIILFFTIHLSAQEKVPTEKTFLDSAIVEYIPGSLKNSNLIIEKLKESFSGDIEDFKIHFQFNLLLSSNPNSTGNVVTIQLLNIKATDNIIYKGFNITSFLQPSNVSIVFDVRKDGQNITHFESNKAMISKNNSKRIVFNYNGFDYFTVNDIVNKIYFFNYSDKTKEKFDNKTNQIDDYYNYLALINLELNSIKEIDLKNIDELVKYRNQVEKTKKFIKSVENKKFNAKLNLNNNDPADFIVKLKNLQANTKKYEEQINYALQNMHVTYYKRGLLYLEQYDTISATKYFRKSIEVKNNYVPSWLQIAEHFLNTEMNDSCAIVLLNVFNKMNLSPELQKAGIKIAKRVSHNYIKIAKQYNQVEKYDSAMLFLRTVSNLCKNISNSLCDENLYNEYTTSHTGIYMQMLEQIKTDISENTFEDAEIMIDSAVNYKNKNNYYIKINNKIIPLISVLYENVIDYADSLLKNENFIESNQQYTYAEKLCKKFVVIPCNNEIYEGITASNQGIYRILIDSVQIYYDNQQYEIAENLINRLKVQQIKNHLEPNEKLEKLEKQIFEKYYLKNIKDARAYLSVKKYEKAVNLLLDANKIQLDYKLPKQEEFDSLYSYSTKLAIITELKIGKRRAAENKINEAKKHYSVATSMVENYQIKISDDLKSSFEELKSNIFSQKCKNAQLDYDVQKNTALRFIEEGKYIKADNALIKSIRIADENSECQILTKEAIKNRDEISNIVYFQKQLIKISRQIEDESYQDALINYINLEKFYKDSNINADSGITLAPLDNFISNNVNGFINYSVKYFAENNQLDEALKYLKLLYSKGYPAKWTESNQNLLGTHLAIKDYKGVNINIPKVFVKQYITDEKWFKYLRKSYLKQCKKLR
ncbi:MAG: hypothetical protein GXO79_02825 [Chlorobi bacterium]|nr:hypothetical protein [Chlorobiota bacterium]